MRKSTLIDMTGKEIQGTKIIERAKTKKTGCVLWLCKCSCGNMFTRTGHILRLGERVKCKVCSLQDKLKKQGQTIEKRKVAAKYTGLCQYPGCNKKPIPDSETSKYEHLCREHYFNDIPYTQPGVQSTLAHYV